MVLLVHDEASQKVGVWSIEGLIFLNTQGSAVFWSECWPSAAVCQPYGQ